MPAAARIINADIKRGHAAIFVNQGERMLQPWQGKPGMALVMHHLAVFHQHRADGNLDLTVVALSHAVHALEGVLIEERTVKNQRDALVRAHRALVRASAIYDYA